MLKSIHYHVGHHRVEQWSWYVYDMSGPLTRYVKLRVAHAPGMPGTFSPPPQVRDPDMHDARAAMNAGIAN